MKKIILFTFLAFAVLNYTNSASRQFVQNEDGYKLYKKNCVLCHGKKGNRQLGGATDLSVSTLNLEERISIITNGRNKMMPYKDKLSIEAIEAIAVYTLSLRI